MSSRNRFISQLAGVQFNGISNEEAAEVLMQWKQAERRLHTTTSDVGARGWLPEQDFLEIPKKIQYFDAWGKINHKK